MSFSKVLLTAFLFLLSITIYAQTDDTACQAIVEQVIASTLSSCVNSEGNTACSNPSSVSAVGASIGANQTVSLSSVSSLESSSISVSGNSWGLAVMNFQTQANNQKVWLLLLGESTVEKQGDSFQNMRLRTGFGAEDCENVPNLVTIYATGENLVDLTINDLQISLQGIATFQFQNTNSFLVSLLSGSLEILDANPIQAGESLVAVTDNEGTVLFWSSARPINNIEVTHGQIAFNIINGLTGESFALEPSCIEQAPHTVASGENLFRISLRYGTTVDELAALNNISDVRRIQLGQEIKLPCREEGVDSNTSVDRLACGPNTVHVVSRGETLFSIAQLYGTTTNAIAAVNNLVNPQTIHAGNIFKIPCDNGIYTAPPPNTSSGGQAGLPNPPAPSSDEAAALQQLCAGLAVTIAETNVSPELQAFYQQTCGG